MPDSRRHGQARAEPGGIEARIPDTLLRPQVHEGMRLSDLPDQDSYSYAVAQIYMGTKNRSTLLRNHERALKGLTFEFGAVDCHFEPVAVPISEE